MDKFLPQFEDVAEIPVVIHVGQGGKKTHISTADISRCKQNGELCWSVYQTACGSAKWTQRGRSGESLLQMEGVAHITCLKCGERDVKLNPQGFDLEKMRQYHEVYEDVKYNLMLNALSHSDREKFNMILSVLKGSNSVNPPITIGDRKYIEYVSAWDKRKIADTPLSLLGEILKGTKIAFKIWNPKVLEFEIVTINPDPSTRKKVAVKRKISKK